MHKEGKWAQAILSQQQPDGKWGCFHSLSQFYDASLTTEQALRRLERLGFSFEDACIQRAVGYMCRCLNGTDTIPDRREKVHDWDVFTRLMLSTWILRFAPEHQQAASVADQWAKVISAACAGGQYDQKIYTEAYRDILHPNGGRIGDPFNFYPLSLLAGRLNKVTERVWIEAILHHDRGVYYLYDRCLMQLPPCFQSRQASYYLDAMEQLARYSGAGEQLDFVAQWLEGERNEDGCWDMGQSVSDKIRFPLSDDWRTKQRRQFDCTERIAAFLKAIRKSESKTSLKSISFQGC